MLVIAAAISKQASTRAYQADVTLCGCADAGRACTVAMASRVA